MKRTFPLAPLSIVFAAGQSLSSLGQARSPLSQSSPSQPQPPATQPQSPPTAASRNPSAATEPDDRPTEALPPRCAEIAGTGTQYEPLARACQFVMSPHNLPNYVCRETMKRFANDRPLDVVTADVTFIDGTDDRYTNLAVNGHTVDSVPANGWRSLALFGNQLTTVFQPRTKTHFEFLRETVVRSGTVDFFSYQFNGANNTTFLLNGDLPGLRGEIAVDKASGRLLRLQSSLTGATPRMRLSSYQSSVTYDNVAIPDLGTVLAPVDGEVRVCTKEGSCFRNVLTFDDCHKFAATSRIIPNEPSQP